MKVTFNAQVSLGNIAYERGVKEIPDSLYANEAFRKHVRAGIIVVHPRDEQAQAVQASKDARAMTKAIAFKRMVEDAVAARAQASSNKVLVGAPSVESLAPAQAAPAAVSVMSAQADPAPSIAANQATGNES